MPAPPNRRAILRAAGLGALTVTVAGCGIDWRAVRLDTAASPTPPTFTADDLARFAAVDLVASLRAQADSLAGTDATIDQLAKAHATQLRKLGPLPGPVPSGSVSPSNWPGTPSPPPSTDVAGLATAEASAAATLLDGIDTLGGPLAALLTSIAGCCRAAAVLLPSGTKIDLAPSPTLPTALTKPATMQVRPALEALVAADDAAGFGYGPAAARLVGADRARAVDLMQRHTFRAMTVRALAEESSVDIPASPAAYTVDPGPDAAAAGQFCGTLEDACARTAAALIGTGDAPARALGQAVLINAADARAAWVGLVPLPGLP